jgi:small subunit ribosomal protein S14e
MSKAEAAAHPKEPKGKKDEAKAAPEPKAKKEEAKAAPEPKEAKDGKETKDAKDKDAKAKKEDVYYGPTKRPNEACLGIAHIYSTKNNTIIHVTDISGAETLVKESGGRMVRAQRDEGSPYAAMQCAQKVAARLKVLGVDGLHIRLCGKGGSTRKLPFSSSQSALRALARAGVKIGRIEDVTPLPHDSTRRAGGRRGRRL